MTASSINRESTAIEPSAWKTWVVASIAAIIILGTALGLMRSLGLFDKPTDDTGVKTLAAALGLVGALLAAALTLVGTIIKYSIDDRNARLAATEADRNYILALETEKRNRIETTIRAVDLLSENNEDATENQFAGAILALVNLGELDFAIALLAQLWPEDLRSPQVAEIVLKEALESGSVSAQISASTLLRHNAEQIQQQGYHIWPIAGLRWRTDLPGNSRIGLIRAAGQWIKSEIAIDRESLPDAAVVLYEALADPDEFIADIAAGILGPVVQVLPESARTDSGGKTVSVEDIAKHLKELPKERITQDGVRFESEIRELLVPKADEPSTTDSTQTKEA